VKVDLQDKPQDFVDLYRRSNPLPGARAKVPLLHVVESEAGGSKPAESVLCESLIVAEFVAERFGGGGGQDGGSGLGGLLPPVLVDRARSRLFTELCGSAFSYFPLLRAKGDKLETSLETYKEGLIGVDAFLAEVGDDEGPFLLGRRFSLAECSAAPFLQRACTILPEFMGSGGRPVHPIEVCDELGLVRLRRWIEAVLERPSVESTGVPKDEMIRSTQKMLERFAAMEE